RWPSRRAVLRRRLLRARRCAGDQDGRPDRAADGRRSGSRSAARRRLSGDSALSWHSVVPAAGRRLLQGAGLAGVDLELSGDAMHALAGDVVSRSIDPILSLPSQPSCGDVDAAELCRRMREPAPERGTPLSPLLDRLFGEWIPRSFTAPGP